MQPDCVLIQVPSIDFRTFVGLTNKALGRNPSTASDASRRHLSDAERFLSCLAAMRDEKAPAGFSPFLLKHVSFSAFIAANDRDMFEILQCATMPNVAVETIITGVQIAVVTGTLAEWRDAIISGCAKGVPTNVRHCFNKLHDLFSAAGLKVWPDYTPRPGPDHTYLLLEDKRGR